MSNKSQSYISFLFSKLVWIVAVAFILPINDVEVAYMKWDIRLKMLRSLLSVGIKNIFICHLVCTISAIFFVLGHSVKR